MFKSRIRCKVLSKTLRSFDKSCSRAYQRRGPFGVEVEVEVRAEMHATKKSGIRGGLHLRCRPSVSVSAPQPPLTSQGCSWSNTLYQSQ